MPSTGFSTILLLLLVTLLCRVHAEEHHKRAPSGFTGVRGKKSIPDGAYADGADTPTDARFLEKRAPSGFMGMRGKKEYGEPWEGTYQEGGLYKRAPSGFLGMRGKKEMETVGYDEFAKRAPSGFMGMRGKKEYDDSDSYYGDKRASMGFMGMRGKKDDDLAYDVEDKRTPSGFFGMRGKKLQRNAGFFGMRGKKYPYEFRGKFVGVRGKKAVSDELVNDELARLGQELDINQLMLLLTEQNEANNQAWNLAQEENHIKQI